MTAQLHRSLNQLVREGNADISDPDTPLEKVYDDVHCGGMGPAFAPLSSGGVANMKECKIKCLRDPRCAYMAFWVKQKRCEIYFACFGQVRDGNNRIVVYKRVSPCEQDLRDYMGKMITEFAPDILRPMYMPFEWEKDGIKVSHPNPNFFCRCTGASWITCGIWALSDSPEWDIFDDKFNPDDSDNMKPFYIMRNGLAKWGGENDFLVFRPRDEPQGTLTEVQLFEYIERAVGENNPGCLRISQCVEGSPSGRCPIQRRPFENGEPVYIRRKDAVKLGTSQRLPCLTVKGLRSWIMNPDYRTEGGFLDPLSAFTSSSTDDSDSEYPTKTAFTVDEDYIMYFIFDEASLSTGICDPLRKGAPDDQTQPQEPQPPEGDSSALPEPSRKSKGKKMKGRKSGKSKKGRPSSEPGPSSPGFSSETGPQSPRPASDPLHLDPDLDPDLPAFGNLFLDSPFLTPISPQSPKPKVTLSAADVAKLRRSFQEAHAKRRAETESDKSNLEKKVQSAVGYLFQMKFASISLCFLLLLFYCLMQACHTSETDVYIEFLAE